MYPLHVVGATLDAVLIDRDVPFLKCSTNSILILKWIFFIHFHENIFHFYHFTVFKYVLSALYNELCLHRTVFPCLWELSKIRDAAQLRLRGGGGQIFSHPCNIFEGSLGGDVKTFLDILIDIMVQLLWESIVFTYWRGVHENCLHVWGGSLGQWYFYTTIEHFNFPFYSVNWSGFFVVFFASSTLSQKIIKI